MSYGRGHCTGVKRHRPGDNAWFHAIQAAALAQIEATWPNDNGTPQEVTSDPTQAVGSTEQARGSIHNAPRSIDHATVQS